MQTRLIRKPRLLPPILTFVLFVAAAALHGAAPRPVRALMWDEQQPEQQRAYGEKFLGEAIAAHLSARPVFAVKNVSLASPSQGLDEVTLNDTDVVIWWSYQKNPFVTDENVERLVTHMRHGSWASLRCIPLTGRGRLCGSCRSGPRTMRSRRFPPRIAPLMPALRQEDGVWKLTLPGCIFPAYRGAESRHHGATDVGTPA